MLTPNAKFRDTLGNDSDSAIPKNGISRFSLNPGMLNPSDSARINEGSPSPSDGHGIGGKTNEHLDANEHPGGWQGGKRGPGKHRSRRCHAAQHNVPDQ